MRISAKFKISLLNLADHKSSNVKQRLFCYLLMQVLRLFAHTTPEGSLVLSEDLPPFSARAIYFVRRSTVHITPSNIEVRILVFIHKHGPGHQICNRGHVMHAQACAM